MRNALTIIWAIAIAASLFAGGIVVMHKQSQRMQQYAIEHNCKWDYNDMCYTKEQKPWLFK